MLNPFKVQKMLSGKSSEHVIDAFMQMTDEEKIIVLKAAEIMRKYQR